MHTVLTYREVEVDVVQQASQLSQAFICLTAAGPEQCPLLVEAGYLQG
jgi:hypothetical protein